MLNWPVLAMLILGCAHGETADNADAWQGNPFQTAPAGRGQNPAPQFKPAIRRNAGQSVLGKPVTNTSYPAPVVPSNVPFKLRVCAWVNGTPIFTGEVFNRASPLLVRLQGVAEPEYSVKREKALKLALKSLIDREIVYQDAYTKLKNNPSAMRSLKKSADEQFHERIAERQQKFKMTEVQFKKVLRQQGLSMEMLRREAERDFMVNEYLLSQINHMRFKIGHAQIKEYYDSHRNEFQTLDRVEWEDLFVAKEKHATFQDAKRFAFQLANRLRNGLPIESLLPYDDGDSRFRKGKGYGERRGEIRPPEVEAHLFQMKPREIRIVDFSTGVHVIRLIKREFAGQLPFSPDVQAKIRSNLQRELLDRERARIIRQLAARTVIDVDPESLK